MAKNQSNDSEPKVLLDEEAILDDIVASPYKYGFTTDLETEEFEKGLSQEIVEKISFKKDEPEFLKNFRIKAFKSWQKIKSPVWAKLDIPEIDYDDIQYYSVPKTKNKLGSLDDVDPLLLETFEKLGIFLVLLFYGTVGSILEIFLSLTVWWNERTKNVD